MVPLSEDWACPHPPTVDNTLMKNDPTIVVLAAGQGSRYKGGGHKLAEPLEGSTVLGCTLKHAIESRLQVVLVTTEAIVPHASIWLARRDIVVLSPEEARRGMGSSIAAGVLARAGAPGWLLLPGDMPLVKPQTLRAVAGALQLHPVVYAQYRGRRGHPVGFSGELYSELIMLGGDEGARRIVARYPVHGQEVDDPGVLVDVDTVADLQAVKTTLQTARTDAESAGP
jgi:molybdenum cofactor cytidylyltransferase